MYMYVISRKTTRQNNTSIYLRAALHLRRLKRGLYEAERYGLCENLLILLLHAADY